MILSISFIKFQQTKYNKENFNVIHSISAAIDVCKDHIFPKH